MRNHRSLMILAAALCVAVAAVHVDDQGGVTVLTDPDWLGWAYRLLEVGAIATAGALLFCAGAGRVGMLTRMSWTATVLVAAGPLVGFVLTRTTGLPGATDDIGNWSETLGVVSMVVEGALLMMALVSLIGTRWRALAPRLTQPATV